MLKALLWDVDGTLAETERDGHRVAFNHAFAALGLPWRWDEARYGELLRITGGRERLLHDMAARSDAPALTDERLALARRLHAVKNEAYARIVDSGSIALREGVLPILRDSRERGLRLGIVTTTSAANVQALLAAHLGPRWRQWFDVVVCGEDTAHKKPHPEAYLRALAGLKLAANEALAIEDSPGGAAAAREAQVPLVVTRSAYFADDPIDGAVAIGPGLHQRAGWRPEARARSGTGGAVELDDLIDWHSRMELVSCGS
ncbi:MAG: HAD-IA family hydrolase [Rubrivivax sp.]|nr:HAD-IA family hydrolase [Rubrivivax sp.]